MAAPTVSIVIPAYNEAERLPATLTRLGQFLRDEAYPAEIVVVDDGSADATVAVAERAAAADPLVRLVRAPHRGKGAAVRRGMLAARGAVRVMCDADLSMPAHELPKLLAPLAAGADVTLATREGDGARRIGEPYRRHLMGRVFNALVRLLAVPGLHDTQCGFKAFRRGAAQAVFSQQTLRGFGFDVEVLFLARRFGYEIRELPIDWYFDPDTRVRPGVDSLEMLGEVLMIRIRDARGQYHAPRSAVAAGGEDRA
jgi:glycosyltransferase involved in cell wall biosynthesis